MGEPRKVHVKLVADTTEYVEAMERAEAATHRVSAALAEVNDTAKLLLECGVDPKDIAAAVKAARALAYTGELSEDHAARIVAKANRVFDLTGSKVNAAADLLATEPPAEPTHGPDYKLTYIESTIQSLSIRGLTITPADVLTGIWKLNAAGIKGSDAETSLHEFLVRLSPFGVTNGWDAHTTFPGWDTIAVLTKTLSNEDLMDYFGSNQVRAALALRKA